MLRNANEMLAQATVDVAKSAKSLGHPILEHAAELNW